jgi:UMF1 family MFS transporter
MKNPHQKTIVLSWCLYDWANSAFTTTIMAAVLPIFFRRVAAATLPTDETHLATSIWGYTSAASMLLVAFFSLFLGPVSDYGSAKKRFLTLFAGFGMLSTALLALAGRGDWLWVSILFILAEIGYGGSEVFYDSLLPHIAGPRELDRISVRAYALGYLGGGILLAINIAMIFLIPGTVFEPGGAPVPVLGMQLSFLTVAVWWGVFTVPLLRNVPEPQQGHHPLSRVNLFAVAVERLSNTFLRIRQYRNIFIFIVAFWFYNDGIGTIIKMATIYGDEIGIGTFDLIGALLLTQAVGIPFSLAFGRLAAWIGAKRAILVGLAAYTGIALGGYFMTRAVHFWILAVCVGLVQGGTQGLSRSLFASLVPKEKSAEFFGFYNISGKFAGVVGPAVFGLVGQLGGTSRFGILSLIFFFVVGGVLLTAVKEKGTVGPS